MKFVDSALLSSVFIFILFSIHLLTSLKGNLLLNKLFAFFLLSRGIQNIFILFLEYNKQFPFSYINSIFPLLMFITPCIVYLYVRSYLNDATTLYKKDLLHLLPGGILIIYIIFINQYLHNGNYFISIHDKFDFANTRDILRAVILFGLRLLLNIFYVVLSWRLIIKAIANKQKPINTIIKNWLIFLVGLLSLFFFTYIFFTIYIVSNQLPLSSFFGNSFMVFFISIILFSLIFYIIKQPLILYGQLTTLKSTAIETAVAVNHPTIESPSDLLLNKPYSLLSAEQIAIYTDKLQDFVASNKPYLDTELTIAKLANSIDIPLHHCSYLLNNVLDLSFRDYVNQFRINYFINEYPNKVATMTIESMAEQAGFKNRSTFNIAFKKETGLTPSEYFSKTTID